MIAAYHLIFTVYGSWLPNDPRGSSSHEIRNPVIREIGELHHGRKRVQPAGKTIRDFYDVAKPLLQNEVLTFDDDQISIVAEAFAEVIRKNGYTCYACAIMADHVHLVIRKHRHKAEQMIENLQEASREALIAGGLRTAVHPVWGGPGWKVYLDTREDIERTIKYVEQNPIKSRRPAQHWPFVVAYDGWLPGLRSERPDPR